MKNHNINIDWAHQTPQNSAPTVFQKGCCFEAQNCQSKNSWIWGAIWDDAQNLRPTCCLMSYQLLRSVNICLIMLFLSVGAHCIVNFAYFPTWISPFVTVVKCKHVDLVIIYYNKTYGLQRNFSVVEGNPGFGESGQGNHCPERWN